MPVGVLEEPDARALIAEPVAGFPQIYTPEAADAIVYLSGRQPSPGAADLRAAGRANERRAPAARRSRT